MLLRGEFQRLTDHFALLQVPRGPWLDTGALKERFLRLAAEFHPDKFHQESVNHKEIAARRYAEINAAYQCLLEPRERLLHLLELETGARPADLQDVPPGLMEMLWEMGRLCREADGFIAERAKTSSALLKVQMFQKGMEWVERLNGWRSQIDLRRQELLAELRQMNLLWENAPPAGDAARPAALPLARLEQLYRTASYLNRWGGQVQERIVQLSF